MAKPVFGMSGRKGAIGWIVFWALVAWLHAEALAQPVRPEDFVTFWAGGLPIILTAPHGGRQAIPGITPRQGSGVAQFRIERDNNTAELAEAIAVRLRERLRADPFLVVAHFERKYVDANRPHHGAYESPAARPYYVAFHSAVDMACKKVRQVWGRGLLLDIHGQAAHDQVIFRGTGNGSSVAALVQRFGREALTGAHSIVGQLERRGYKTLPEPTGDARELLYSGGYMTQNYGSHRGTAIDAIQLEFGAYFRLRANLDKTAADLADALVSFARVYLPPGPSPVASATGAQP